MRKLFCLIILALALPAAAAASDVVATYKYSDGSMVTLCTRDASHVRMDTSPTSYMLLSGGKVYAVNRGDDGTCTVMDMDTLKSSGGGLTSMFGGGSTPEYDVRYEKTGKTESIAGYKGTVYKAVVFEDGKVVSRDEIVLSSHGNIKKLTEAWMAMASRMTNMAASFEASTEEARKMGYGGVLRYGNDMRLAKLKVMNLKSAYYQLPSGSNQVQAQPAAQQSDDMGLSDDAKEIGMDAKQSTKEEIKEGIRGAIGSIFD
ncbi:hypothetical protein GM415_17230 [Pseudodesulfovibrio cashew]|uniref:DUF4412 domain-containing protein n=1 Tax=Pseudodesulfovibrio cashew TaxID=2678688 RepID=A0A6I6JLB3_9BACT|nr:hypothetical protein [Pseudodesulfovibrio cashew]QGY41790.1 hypothetical protein GM415_17230 [Pseudodesulfovibrio cashew]